MRKIVCLLFAVMLLAPLSIVPSAAVERSLGNMSVPIQPGIDTLGLGVPTVLRPSLGHPNIPKTLGLDADLQRMLPLDNVDRTLIRPVQYNCRWDCHGCRESCAIRWKGNCAGPYCRRGFSDCMKACWRDVCRYCR